MKNLWLILSIFFVFITGRSISQSRLLLEHQDDFIHELTNNDYDNDGNTCETIITLTNNTIEPSDYDCLNTMVNWDILIDLWTE